MSDNYPKSYSIFDELAKSEAYPESYSIFDDLAQKAQEPQEPEGPGLMERTMESFGKGLSMQAQMGSQPEAIPQLASGALEGLTLSAVDVNQPKTGGGQVFRELGRMGGLTGPIKLIGSIFKPLGMWGSIAGTGTAGAAVEAGKQYFKDKEMKPEDIAIEAAIWAGLQGSIILGSMVNYISKASGKSIPETMRFLWDKVKGKIKNPFKTPPTEEAIEAGQIELNPEVEEEIVKEAEKVAKELTPVEEVKPEVKPEVKAEEPKPAVAKVEVEEVKSDSSPEFNEDKVNEAIQISFYSGDNPRDRITNLIKDLSFALKHKTESRSKFLIDKSFKFLLENGYSKADIEQTVYDVMRKNMSIAEAEAFVKDLFGKKPKQVKEPKPAEPKKPQEKHVIKDRPYWRDYTTQEKIEDLEGDIRDQEYDLEVLIEREGKEVSKERSKLIQELNKNELDADYLRQQLKKENAAKVKKPEPAVAEEFPYTKEDFPTKKEAEDYLEHLKKSLAKGPEAQRPSTERDIKNLEELIKTYPAEEGKEQTFTTAKEKKQEAPPIVEVKVAEEKPSEPSPSGYEKLPTPTTYPEKVKHLARKIQDSKDYQLKLRQAIAENEKKIKEVDVSYEYIRDPSRQYKAIEDRNKKLANLRNNLATKKAELKSEKKYESDLRKDLADLKKNKGKSRVEVPLGKTSIRQPNPKLEPKRPVIGKKQAVARSKIIKLFRKAFKDPIRLGKFKQHAAGIHKLWARVTRLLKDNDIETAAHEIGHNLHTLLYRGNAKTPSEERNNISNALKPYLNELKPLAHYEPFGMEGFAEFTRLYVTNPDVALEMAPKFYAKFEADLEAQYPELKNALLEARQYYDTYLQGTPDSRIESQIDFGDKGRIEAFTDWIQERANLDKIKTNFLDDVFPAKRLVADAFGIKITEVEALTDPRNLYKSLRLLKGAIGKGDVFIKFETFDIHTLEKTGPGLYDILKELKTDSDYVEFNKYLVARRSIEKAEQNVETGISYGDAIYTERAGHEKWSELAKRFDKWNDALLKYYADSGRISQATYKLFKENNLMYASFRRVMEPEKAKSVSGAGSKVSKQVVFGMKGSARDIIPPLESALHNAYELILSAEKNRSAQILGELAKMKGVGKYVEAVPTPIELKGKVYGKDVEEKIATRLYKAGLPDLVVAKVINGRATFGLREDLADAIPEVFLEFGGGKYPQGENIVTAYYDGKPQYYEVSPEIYEMWTKGIEPYNANMLVRVLRVPARMLRYGAITNPRFIQKNFFEDWWGGLVYTQYGGLKNILNTLYEPLAMIAMAAGQGELYVQWLKSGGGMASQQSVYRTDLIKKLDEIWKGIAPWQLHMIIAKFTEVSEESNRLVEFGRAMKFEQKTRLGMENAAFASRDISIDFAKMGLLVKAINQIIPFFNARLQGMDKIFRAACGGKKKEFFLRTASALTMPALIAWYLSRDDEEYEEFSETERDANMMFKIGGEWIKLPVPHAVGVLINGLTQRMAEFMYKHDEEAFKGLFGSIKEASLPQFIPTAANPFIEIWANKSAYTGQRIVPQSKEGLIAKYQYKNNTSTTARLIGRAMTYMLGQETRSKAASPAVIDHFIYTWTGGLGRLIVQMSDASLEAAGLSDKVQGPEQTIVERFGLNAFSVRYPRASTRSIEEFYDNWQDATARQRSFKLAEKESLETPEDIVKAKMDFRKMYDYDNMKVAYKVMQRSQKAINNIYNDPSIEPALKRQYIDDLYLQQIEFARSVNKQVKKYRSEH